MPQGAAEADALPDADAPEALPDADADKALPDADAAEALAEDEAAVDPAAAPGPPDASQRQPEAARATGATRMARAARVMSGSFLKTTTPSETLARGEH